MNWLQLTAEFALMKPVSAQLAFMIALADLKLSLNVYQLLNWHLSQIDC